MPAPKVCFAAKRKAEMRVFDHLGNVHAGRAVVDEVWVQLAPPLALHKGRQNCGQNAEERPHISRRSGGRGMRLVGVI